MDTRTQTAFQGAADVIKQFITIATVIIAFTVSLSKDFIVNVAPDAKEIAYQSWYWYLGSTILGLVALMRLVGIMGSDRPELSSLDHAKVYDSVTQLLSFLQILTFVIGVICTIRFGVIAASSAQKAEETQIERLQARLRQQEKQLTEQRKQNQRLRQELSRRGK